jgi:hypothetical protein
MTDKDSSRQNSFRLSPITFDCAAARTSKSIRSVRSIERCFLLLLVRWLFLVSELLLLTRWPRRVERIFLAILFCTIAEPAIAQLNFELPGQCAGVPTLSEQFAPSITSKKPTPPASVPESAANSLSALQNAADDGDLIAQWKLGRMYADGDGVAQDDLHAFEYFRRIADTHAEDSPSAPQAAIVANAFVALGRYYLSGIPNSSIKADPEWAREMFSYAASHLGNNAMTILALIIQLYGGTWELPMPRA